MGNFPQTFRRVGIIARGMKLGRAKAGAWA